MRLEVIIFRTLLLLINECVVNSAHYSNLERQQFSPEDSSVCGKEFSMQPTLAQEISKTEFIAGESDIFQCNHADRDLNFEHRNHPKRFIIYPQTTRECRKGGTWSGPIPMCVKKEDGDDPYIAPSRFLNCSLHHPGSLRDVCLSSHRWERIGEVHSRCENFAERSTNIEYEFLTRSEIIFLFPRAYYFSFVIFRSPDISNVEIFARSESVLRNVSEEGRDFLLNHYDKWQALSNDSSEKECPVVNVHVYTNQLRIHYSAPSTKLSNETDSDPLSIFEFYRILNCQHKSPLAGQCPKEPIIPNVNDKKVLHNTVEYTCKNGFVMIDPVSNSQSNGTITCIDGDWHPYPFPVCKRLVLVQSQIVSFTSSKFDLSVTALTHVTTTETFNVAPGRSSLYATMTALSQAGEITVSRSTTKEERVEVSMQFSVTFGITATSLLILGAISSSAIVIICVKYRRRRWEKRDAEQVRDAISGGDDRLLMDPFGIPISDITLEGHPIEAGSWHDSDFGDSSGVSIRSSSSSIHKYDYPFIVQLTPLRPHYENC